jgi:hypothetical protein
LQIRVPSPTSHISLLFGVGQAWLGSSYPVVQCISPRETPEVTYIDDEEQEEEEEEERRARLVTDRVSEVSVLVTAYRSLLHPYHHVRPPVPLHWETVNHRAYGLGDTHPRTTNYSSVSRHSRIHSNRHAELSSSLQAQPRRHRVKWFRDRIVTACFREKFSKFWRLNLSGPSADVFPSQQMGLDRIGSGSILLYL